MELLNFFNLCEIIKDDINKNCLCGLFSFNCNNSLYCFPIKKRITLYLTDNISFLFSNISIILIFKFKLYEQLKYKERNKKLNLKKVYIILIKFFYLN